MTERQRVIVRLTQHQQLRCESWASAYAWREADCRGNQRRLRWSICSGLRVSEGWLRRGRKSGKIPVDSRPAGAYRCPRQGVAGAHPRHRATS